MPNHGLSNIIIGNTTNRATAARGGWMGQGEVIASYEGSIPRQAVRDLIDWEPIKVDSANLVPVEDVSLADTVLPDGRPAKTMIVEGVKSIVRSDTFANLGRFNDDYNGNAYSDYEEATHEIVGDAPYLSAGELRGGRQFFFQVGMDENIHDGSTGLEFMPYMMFRSSLDGSLANTWDRGSIICKCDNMFPAISKEARRNGSQVKFKRSRYSAERLFDLPRMLGIQAQDTVDFARSMSQVPVLRSQFIKTLDIIVPLPGENASKIAVTKAENTRQAIDALYQNSPMVADWNGTAFGVFQAFDTYYNRVKPVRGANKIDRVFDRVLTGKAVDEGLSTLNAMQRVLGRELVAV
jgi:phage/plasmid-like protein (TIGR03299 family)